MMCNSTFQVFLAMKLSHPGTSLFSRQIWATKQRAEKPCPGPSSPIPGPFSDLSQKVWGGAGHILRCLGYPQPVRPQPRGQMLDSYCSTYLMLTICNKKRR